MKILVVGSGGREDALAWRLSRDADVEDAGVEVATTPGNPGTKRWGRNIPGPALEAARVFRPDLVVVGPEAPLADGLADRLRADGFAVFGPGSDGAQLEASKIFSKELMQEAGIPTAEACFCDSLAGAMQCLAKRNADRIVIKADGLAAGKGVTVARSRAEAEKALAEIFVEKRFGAAGRRVLLESILEGREASVLALTDGKNLHVLPSSEDHKAVFDGDRGPNTGGMGVIAPTPVVTPKVLGRTRERILEPLLDILRARGIDYRGVIYAGLMVKDEEPSVVEFNCRFGDPETEAILPLITGPFAETLLSAARGSLDATALGETGGASACVILASGGYPGEFNKGLVIEGPVLDRDGSGNAQVFVAGAEEKDGRLVTAGGRVLAVVGAGDDADSALGRAYGAAREIRFEGMHFRTDIGRRETRS